MWAHVREKRQASKVLCLTRPPSARRFVARDWVCVRGAWRRYSPYCDGPTHVSIVNNIRLYIAGGNAEAPPRDSRRPMVFDAIAAAASSILGWRENDSSTQESGVARRMSGSSPATAVAASRSRARCRNILAPARASRQWRASERFAIARHRPSGKRRCAQRSFEPPSAAERRVTPRPRRGVTQV